MKSKKNVCIKISEVEQQVNIRVIGAEKEVLF